MTSKTSLFNIGIFKSVIKRFSWGSLLYFVALFLTTGLPIITTRHYYPADVTYFQREPLILYGSYMGFPLFLALCVPTVVALLVFRFIHSKKQVVFTHALPVSRKANYISSLLGGFSLMALPIIANAVVLMIISASGYGLYFSIADCVTWLWMNLFSVYMMYSCAVFSAVITGNSFAMIAINLLVHIYLFVASASTEMIADIFLYGISDTNAVTNVIAENNFGYIVMNLPYGHSMEKMTGFKFAEFIIIPIVIYVISYYLYKNRKSETATDVAGFKGLEKAFKYLVTLLASLFTFALFSDLHTEMAGMIITLFIISFIAYFGSEMLIKKTVNVFGAYKGYIAFMLLFSAFLSVFAFTSFFGFEKRVPKLQEVESVAVYSYYYQSDEPFTEDEEIIRLALNEHSELVEKIPFVIKQYYHTNLHIKYKFKNGEEMSRRYPLNNEDVVRIMNKLYENKEYKLMCEMSDYNKDNIISMRIDGNEQITDTNSLLNELKKDIENLSYEKLHPEYFDDKYYPLAEYNSYAIEIEYVEDDNNSSTSEKRIRYAQVRVIDDKYPHTIKWLKDNNYIQ